MSVEDFNSLSLSEKLYFATEKGIYLDDHFTRFGEMQLISIYSYEMFYVEIIFSIEQEKILHVIGFIDGERLDRYSSCNLREFFS